MDEEEELFKRVNKSQFNSVQKIENTTEDSAQKYNKIKENNSENNRHEENKSEIVENYFKSLEDKRKGKHF